jgi:predicted O-methyltransferase YrrM
MSYQYPEHFKYPEGERYFFLNHVDAWEHFLPNYGDEPRICLEIGALYGGSSVYILENFCKMNGSHHYIMDINTNEYIENNINPYKDKVTYILGESADSFKTFQHNDKTKEFLDFVYIDGNHMSKYVLEDAVNAFYCLKDNGYIIFDDYGGGLEQEQYLQVKTGADAFYHGYHKYLDIVHNGYQVIMKKINFTNEKDLKENYYKV